MGQSLSSAQSLMDSRLARAAAGDLNACFDLGIAYASGGDGVDVDLIQAHKWFNLASMGGSERAQAWRAEIAEELTAREVAEALRQARAWLACTTRQAA
ncbi:SEL1-like repeat protein [Flavisphingomonas formosensis]|uniref:SEL1-like repeat protein n=1 Tax=Flavisphingomonas formosensis TaxID=861534 RepID=UPI0012F8D1D4|nr:SEL1-like repeat protein [Sphingomonas formosensis]